MMQLLQTTEGSIPSLSIKKAKPKVTKEQQPSEEKDPKSIAETTNVKEASEEGKDESKSELASFVAAMVDEEEPPATLADESHVELDEEELLDEAKEEEFNDELKEEEEESKDLEIDKPSSQQGTPSQVVIMSKDSL